MADPPNSADANDQNVERICQLHDNDPALLIEILHAIQKELGWISDDTIAVIAHALNRTRAEILGVVSFYHDFARTPGPNLTVHICRAEACQALGCETLVQHAQQICRIPIDQTGNGKLELRSVYCLGNCALGPAIRIGDRLYGRVTPDLFDRAVALENT